MNFSIKRTFFLAKKEIISLLANPIIYIGLIIFLVLWEFIFFKTSFLIKEASLRYFFGIFPWLSLLFLPALSMGSISQEKGKGTLEILISSSLRIEEIILGKLFSELVFVIFLILATGLLAFSFSLYGDFDWGMFFGQILAILFFSLFVLTFGIFISSFFKNPISSFIISAAGLFFFLIIGADILTMSVPLKVGNALRNLSLIDHFAILSRGVLTLRDLWYFGSFTCLFLFLTFLRLSFKRRKIKLLAFLPKNVLILVILSTTFVFLSNCWGNFPGRFDLTLKKLYSLSETTKRIISNLKKEINITLYASSQLPPSFQQVLRTVKEILKDYQRQSKGKISLYFKDPLKEKSIEKEAQENGIVPVDFNVIGEGEFKIKRGYFGILIASEDGKKEKIPFLRESSLLEYQLTSYIKELTTEKKKEIVYLIGTGQEDFEKEYQIFYQELKRYYQVKKFSPKESLKDNVDLLIIIGPKEKFSEKTISEIENFLKKGGSLFVAGERFLVEMAGLTLSKNVSNIFEIIEKYGVKIKEAIVYDLKSNETVAFGGRFFDVLLSYPFWPRVISTKKVPQLLEGISNIVLAWPSAIEISSTSSYDILPIFTTSKFSGIKENPTTKQISPNFPLSRKNLGQKIVAVLIEKQEKNSPRIILIADSDFLLDPFLKRFPQNLAFLLQSISWLTKEKSLAHLQLKARVIPTLEFKSKKQIRIIKYGNLAFSFTSPLFLALFFQLKRKRKKKKASFFFLDSNVS